MTSAEQAVRKYIATEIMSGEDEASLDLDYPLLDTGVIDSLDLQKLVVFLETQFDVTVDDDELVPENFHSIRAIGSMVERLAKRPR